MITAVEGNRQWLDGGAMYGNAPRAVWERWSPPDARHRIPLACRCMLVELPAAQGADGESSTKQTRRVLFETGIGAFFDPALRDRFGVDEPGHVLLDNLARLGLTDADIDVVVLSHLHFDHAGGLLSAWRADQPLTLLFPNATFVVSEAAWSRAQRPHPRDRASFIPELSPLLERSGRLHLLPAGTVSDPVLGERFRFHYSDGHTPGLLCTEFDPAGPTGPDSSPIVFASDLIPGAPWVHTAITMGYDRYPERLIDEKTALLEDLLARNGRIFFTHDPKMAIGTVTRDAKGRFGVV